MVRRNSVVGHAFQPSDRRVNTKRVRSHSAKHRWAEDASKLSGENPELCKVYAGHREMSTFQRVDG